MAVVFVQWINRYWLFVTPWTTAHQASLSITISLSLIKLMSIESAMLSNYLIVCHLFLLPSVFPSMRLFFNESAFHISGQSTGATASVLTLNIQGWFPLGLTFLISLLSKGLSRVFCSTTAGKHQFFCAQPSLWSNSHICAWLLEKP